MRECVHGGAAGGPAAARARVPRGAYDTVRVATSTRCAQPSMLRLPCAAAAVLAAALAAPTDGAITKDAVAHLPGLAAPLPSRLYSGYLEPSPGHMLHYIFMESWNKPATDPVAVWVPSLASCLLLPECHHRGDSPD